MFLTACFVLFSFSTTHSLTHTLSGMKGNEIYIVRHGEVRKTGSEVIELFLLFFVLQICHSLSPPQHKKRIQPASFVGTRNGPSSCE